MKDHAEDMLVRTLRRRDALLGLGGLGAAAIWQANGSGALAIALAADTPRASAAAACILTPEVTEGPFWIANHLTRRNITDHQAGLPLALHLTVVHANRCTAMRNADVEVWQADATGTYSGYSGNVIPGGSHATPDNAARFLRGHQRTDADGRALFDTIYPGWYSGRTPHIHLKVHIGGSVVHTGQLFFADATSDAVYRTGAYKPHGQPTTTNRTDGYYAQAGGSRAQLHLTRRRGHLGYSAQITVGVVT